DEAGGDDHALADVERGERGLAFDRRSLVSAQRAVEALGLVLLIREILHRLEIEQAVDRFGVGFAVALVHLAAELDPPISNGDGEDDVANNGGEGDEREARRVEAAENGADEADLEQRRHHIEEHVGKQELGTANAALDGAGEAAGLALEMKAERERMKMAEGG